MRKFSFFSRSSRLHDASGAGTSRVFVTAPLFCFLNRDSDGREPALDISLNGAAGTLDKCLLAAAFSFPPSSNFVTNLNGSFVLDEFEYNPLVVFLSDNPGAVF